ncbi:hypothetical protein [Mycobacterium nebraskense]|uniref:hypothetical protein n=1 Tax=Mycobacterium nebraskense TaxID=244292 RepID=UPI0006181577|nr:hypothetical protein [Mycobacterium nebraskense]KKC04529.1 hypothetical protein WU83_13195 [Mycobacterium nebraskense]
MTDAKYYVVQSYDDVLELDKPGTIRWASGSPDGPRSLTWQVVGARNSDDVYIGARGMMGDQKLSLHQSGVWRWAFTRPAAERHLPPGADPLIQRYSPGDPLAPGWLHGARIRTPSTTFCPAFEEPRPTDRQPIRFFAEPDRPYHLEYHVLLGDAGAEHISVQDAFIVGGMPLTSGKWVWVIGKGWTMDEYTEQIIGAMVDFAAKTPNARAGIANGETNGVPQLLDLANLQRPEAQTYDDAADT